MTDATTPIARRYWFADADAITALDGAEDPPHWGASDLPVTIFCRDDTAIGALSGIAGDVPDLRVIDARDESGFGALVARELQSESALYLQLTMHAVEDFPASIELIAERLASGEPRVLTAVQLRLGCYGYAMPNEEDFIGASNCWISANELRTAFAENSPASAAAVILLVEKVAGDRETEKMPIVSGVTYLRRDEQPVLGGSAAEAAFWRTRTAAAWSEIERLRSEKRIRSGREAALRARHERDLAQQAERTRGEIHRLHRAAGWAGRWRARFARVFGRR